MTTCVYCGGLFRSYAAEIIVGKLCECQYPTARVEDVKTPPPLTPKDSLSVEVEEARFSEGMEKEAKVIRARAWFTDETFGYDRWKADSFAMGKGTHDCYIVMKDEFLETYRKVKALEDKLRRKDEAIEKALDVGVYPKETVYAEDKIEPRTEWQNGFNEAVIKITERYEAALAEGKEGGE